MDAALDTISLFNALSRSVGLILFFSRAIILSNFLICWSIFFTRWAVISIFGSSSDPGAGAAVGGLAGTAALSAATRRAGELARARASKAERSEVACTAEEWCGNRLDACGEGKFQSRKRPDTLRYPASLRVCVLTELSG